LIARYRSQIEEIRKTLGNTRAARDAIQRLQDQILLEANKIKENQRRFREQLRRELEERQERIRRGVELDIELADINENTRRRINLRLKLIAQLKREAKVLKLTGNALKENRNEQARIRKEIEELRGEQKDTGDAFGKLAFEFLQTQQGFAATLLSNLLPTGATAGTVGGAQPVVPIVGPAPAVTKEAGIAQAREGGISAGQMSTLIGLTRQMLLVLKDVHRGTGHPEARYQRVSSGAAQEFLGGV